MKILGIGNSFTRDCMHLLYKVYQAEKPGTELEMSMAYHRGSSLQKHLQFYNNQEAVYWYFRWNSDKDDWDLTKGVKLQDIICTNDWDYVSMQQSSANSGVPSTYNEDIQTIQNIVCEHLGYKPTFFWNMTWAYPEIDPTGTYLLGDNYVDGGAKAPNFASFKNYYNNSQTYMYQKIVETVQAKIVPDDTFQWIMPAGTAIQNTQTSYMTDLNLYRDHLHLNDFGRLLGSYVWYGILENTVPTFNLTSVPEALRHYPAGKGDWVLSVEEMDVLRESVTNALKTPFAVTQSQYQTN